MGLEMRTLATLMILVGVVAFDAALSLGIETTPDDTSLTTPKARETIEHILDSSYQTSLPTLKETAPRTIQLPTPASWVSVVVRWFLIAVIAAVAALCITWIVRSFWNRRGSRESFQAEESPEQVGPRPTQLADAETLAASGEFAEAVHTLLLSALESLRHVAPRSIADAYTSREIFGQTTLVELLPESARRALGELIGAVELFHFGGVPARESDFQRCLEQFQILSSAQMEALR